MNKCLPILMNWIGKRECTTSQLECGCGRIRCVARERVGDDFWDCEDGSDELFNVTQGKSCPDGSKRRNGANSVLLGQLQLCTDPNLCHNNFGEICIVALPAKSPVPLSESSEIRRAPQRTYQKEENNSSKPSEERTIHFGSNKQALVDECANRTLNDCDPNASCMDSPLAYECLCREGFLDISVDPVQRPGRKCMKLVNECSDARLNNCSPNAKCIDKTVGYTCRCSAGFVDDPSGVGRGRGRVCTKRGADSVVDECSSMVHDCDPNALCRDEAISFSCHCPFGFSDASSDPTKPGRICVKSEFIIFEITHSEVDTEMFAYRSDLGEVEIRYADRVAYHEFISLEIWFVINSGSNPCQDYSLHDCDAVAECYSEQPGYFQCRCPKGFIDVSPDTRNPGRKCTRGSLLYTIIFHLWNHDSCERFLSADVCVNMDCAAEAECRETPVGPMCQCVSGFVDVSRHHGRPPGRVCRPVLNECAERKHDCSSHASCIDTIDGFTCRCHDNYRDESPFPSKNPGRVCIRAFVPDPPECDVSDPMSCDQSKSEVCVFVSGTYKCRCASGYSRLPDGRCLAINECEDNRLNTCGQNAECIDLAEGYTCQCRSGFADVSPSGQPGRICKPRINECSNKEKYHVDCDENAICIDTDDSFNCQCRPGFADISAAFNRLPGRRCIEAVNECSVKSLNDCSEFAFCEDAKEGYVCSCRVGYVDASPNVTHYPGRICRKPTERLTSSDIVSSFSTDSCDPKRSQCGTNEACTDRGQRGHYSCQCADNAFRYSDGTCRVFSACSKNTECDRNAVCLNVFDSYSCQCRPGFIDMSPDPERKPGRLCKELVNECATASNECSRFAKCTDLTEGYACQCLDGYIDVSSKYKHPPGRRCTKCEYESTRTFLRSEAHRGEQLAPFWTFAAMRPNGDQLWLLANERLSLSFNSLSNGGGKSFQNTEANCSLIVHLWHQVSIILNLLLEHH
uniref:EGF-like domain-containing protein n=1 Tax=Angiostrongylus cantonensis TaxID=6313 RepID=A0A158PBM6_ANGCA